MWWLRQWLWLGWWWWWWTKCVFQITDDSWLVFHPCFVPRLGLTAWLAGWWGCFMWFNALSVTKRDRQKLICCGFQLVRTYVHPTDIYDDKRNWQNANSLPCFPLRSDPKWKYLFITNFFRITRPESKYVFNKLKYIRCLYISYVRTYFCVFERINISHTFYYYYFFLLDCVCGELIVFIRYSNYMVTNKKYIQINNSMIV